jgi:FSR family fosmidomycin resistance protein-like MFS transporter
VIFVRSLPIVLWLLALAHGLIDAFAGTVQPLWPDLQRALALDEASIQWAYVLWSMATSVSQLAFGYYGDRARGRWLLWLGPVVGVVCLSAVGLAGSFGGLAALLIVGGLGIAAFHPEAAALAGSSAPHDRSRAMSIFSVGGYIGQAVGPIYSGALTTHFGLKALVWGVVWGLPLMALITLRLRPGTSDAPHPHVSAAPPVSLAELLRGRLVAVAVLLAIGLLRVLPALGVPLAIAYLLKGRGASNETIGVVQSVFLGAIGAGSLTCAVFVRRAAERRVLWLLPLAVGPLLWICPALDSTALTASAGIAGLLLGATMPILVSYGQQLMPEGQRVASSITMGVTWGLGGVAVAVTMTLVNRAGRPDLAFPVFAVGCLVSSLLCAALPELEGAGQRRVAMSHASR